jgi:hypothetical protein
LSKLLCKDNVRFIKSTYKHYSGGGSAQTVTVINRFTLPTLEAAGEKITIIFPKYVLFILSLSKVTDELKWERKREKT